MSYFLERLSILAKKGFYPSVVYDIGAYKGEWSAQLCRLFPHSRYFLFEGNEDNRPWLCLQPFPFYIAVLSESVGEATFYCSTQTSSTGESLFPEMTSHFQGNQLVLRPVQTTTLSALAKKEQLPKPDLVKLDVQGAERLILQGGAEWLCHAEAMVLELKFLEYNRGAPLIAEMFALMEGYGYVASDILELHMLPTQELNDVDVLFLKKGSPLIKSGLYA